MWKIHPPHGDQQRKHRVTLMLSCDGPRCSVVALRADNLLSSPATGHPPQLLPTHSTPPQVCLTLHPEDEAWKPRPGAAFKNQRLRASWFRLLTCARLSRPKKKKKWERCSPPTPIFKKALPTPFALTKALPSCCHLNIRAPPKEKGIWHAPFK